MRYVLGLVGIVLPMCALAQDRDFTVSAPTALVDTGILQHLLPRFSLKHGVRITQVPGGGDAVFGADGRAVFSGLQTVWHLDHNGGAGPVLFTDWLGSDIGKRAIASFQPNGEAIFTGEIIVERVTVELTYEGDPIAGEGLSLTHCGRCHVINESNRMDGMGQTPSFAVMRTFEDWENRFSTFYVLNPHPSFSQIKDITPPFPLNLPPAIVPLEITQDDLESIIAYVATIPPADLGAPLQNQ